MQWAIFDCDGVSCVTSQRLAAAADGIGRRDGCPRPKLVRYARRRCRRRSPGPRRRSRGRAISSQPRFKAAHLWVGLIATVTAAAAAATIVASNAPVLSGSLALVAALASANIAFVKPDEKAAQHLAAAREPSECSLVNMATCLHPQQAENPTLWRAT